MATWSSPPTFSDGNVLSATQLNTLSDDLTYLYGVSQAINAPVLSMYSAGISLTSSNNLWYFRYQLPYLHYKCRCVDYGINDFAIYINGVKRYEDLTDYTPSHTYQSYIDLSALGLTLGNLYSIYIVAGLDAFAPFYVDGFFQSASTSTPF